MNRIFPINTLLTFSVGFLLHSLSFAQGIGGNYSVVNRPSDLSSTTFCGGIIQPPIEIKLDVSNLEEVGGGKGVAEILLTVTPLTESTRVSWEITAPAPLSFLSGNRQGVTSVKEGEQVTKTVTLSIPDEKRYHIYARAILETERGEIFTRAVSQYVDLGAPDIEHPSFIRRDPVRGDVTSYKGVVLEGGAR